MARTYQILNFVTDDEWDQMYETVECDRWSVTYASTFMLSCLSTSGASLLITSNWILMSCSILIITYCGQSMHHARRVMQWRVKTHFSVWYQLNNLNGIHNFKISWWSAKGHNFLRRLAPLKGLAVPAHRPYTHKIFVCRDSTKLIIL